MRLVTRFIREDIESQFGVPYEFISGGVPLDRAWQQLESSRSPGQRWVRCSNEASADDVGSLCAMLLT